MKLQNVQHVLITVHIHLPVYGSDLCSIIMQEYKFEYVFFFDNDFYRLCKLQPGDIICDPMCGGGSIPIQVGQWPGVITRVFTSCPSVHVMYTCLSHIVT